MRINPIAVGFAFCVLSLTAVARDDKPAKLPPQPWHLADIWWEFEEVTTNFTLLEVDP
jgi:hypothetical protein